MQTDVDGADPAVAKELEDRRAAERTAAARKVAERRVAKSVVREWVEALSVALLLALFIRTFVVQAFKIPSGSMLPTLQIGDHILVNKFAYGVRVPFLQHPVIDVGRPRAGDVVVFIYPEDPQKDFIKRVVAVAGDVVEVRSKHLYVNDRQVDDPHAHFVEGVNGRGLSPRDNYGPYTVPPGSVFVMGDNRDRSYDSRFWGPVPLDQLKGKAFLIYWSWDGDDRWVRWERIGDLIY
ncbi:MAG: signal peptidase [Candidatus Binatota bacterium]|jgi:signal peptidase I|nr:signal peptidase [Candidatus Binatota bacterium]